MGTVDRFIQTYGGRFLKLRAQGQRLITFSLTDKVYKFDPNRIFSDHGIEMTLREHSVDYSKFAHDAVARLRDTILATINQDLELPITAVHNNTNEAPLSVASYAPGGSHEGVARRVLINYEQDPDDFFLVTALSCFNILAEAGFNTVLQSQTATDDGSLSVYFHQKNLSYVNIEAENGHSTEQFYMLKTLFDRRNSCSK